MYAWCMPNGLFFLSFFIGGWMMEDTQRRGLRPLARSFGGVPVFILSFDIVWFSFAVGSGFLKHTRLLTFIMQVFTHA